MIVNCNWILRPSSRHTFILSNNSLNVPYGLAVLPLTTRQLVSPITDWSQGYVWFYAEDYCLVSSLYNLYSNHSNTWNMEAYFSEMHLWYSRVSSLTPGSESIVDLIRYLGLETIFGLRCDIDFIVTWQGANIIYMQPKNCLKYEQTM